MTCASCAARIEKNVAKLPGVREVNVNLASERARVVLNGTTALRSTTSYHMPVLCRISTTLSLFSNNLCEKSLRKLGRIQGGLAE
ncbi:cation transporter [Alicyclobacillus acidiphilus]|uniref:cation transporter n=1 Tax=Alicyclobacillus acidiphilus TaxID=182455 RepID=UPI00351EA68B